MAAMRDFSPNLIGDIYKNYIIIVCLNDKLFSLFSDCKIVKTSEIDLSKNEKEFLILGNAFAIGQNFLYWLDDADIEQVENDEFWDDWIEYNPEIKEFYDY